MGTSTTLIVLKQLSGNPPTHLDPLQTLLAAHIDSLVAGWFAIWFMTGVVLVAKVIREYLHYRKNSGSQSSQEV